MIELGKSETLTIMTVGTIAIATLWIWIDVKWRKRLDHMEEKSKMAPIFAAAEKRKADRGRAIEDDEKNFAWRLLTEECRPKDGQRVLVLDAGEKVWIEQYREFFNTHWWEEESLSCDEFTHWMPLPESHAPSLQEK